MGGKSQILILNILFGLNLFLCHQVQAALDIPGGVSLKITDLDSPASDLYYQDHVLSLPEALELRKELSQKGENLSVIDPEPSDIWRTEGFEYRPLALPDTSEFQYQGFQLSRDGNFRFTAKTLKDMDSEGYVFLLGKKSFVTLLRQELLKKLGYQVLSMKRIPQIQLHFNSEDEKNNFIQEMTGATQADPRVDRWILSETTKSLVIQDLVARPQVQSIYDLTLGSIDRETISQRRVFNSLLALYNLLDVSESINITSFEAHKRAGNDYLVLPFDIANEFSATLEDILWIYNKIASLSQSDWKDITHNADLPEEVALLLEQKLISRAQSLLKVLRLKPYSYDYNPQISLGKELQNGKLLKSVWPGYGSHFAYGDPKTPLNNKEIKNFFKSKLITNAINNALTYFNTEFLTPDLNRSSLINEQFNKARLDYLFKVFEGKSKKRDLYLFSFPTLGGQVILNRNINIGGIDGGESKIMLADSFGFRVNGGYQWGTFDFPIERDLTAGTEVGITRVYTHLTPLYSIEKALNTPYKNMIVNWYKKHTYKSCEPLLVLDPERSQDEVNQISEDCYKLLNDTLGKGESLIITDNLDWAANFKYTHHFDQWLRFSTRLTTHAVTVRRIHLYRASKHEFHLYQDKGLKGDLDLAFGLEYAVPILTIRFNKAVGKLQTEYYPWKLSDKPSASEKRNFLNGLTQFLLNSDTDLIKSQVDPLLIQHKFSSRTVDIKPLIWHNTSRTDSVETELQHSEDKTGEYNRHFITYSSGKRKGRNYIELASNLLGEFAAEQIDDERVNVDFGSDQDPANTPFGHSITREVKFEGELATKNSIENPTSIFRSPSIDLLFSWRGWKIDQDKAQEITENINDKFSFPFFHKDLLSQTNKIQIYRIGVKVTLYNSFIEKLMKLDKKTIKKYIKKSDLDGLAIPKRRYKRRLSHNERVVAAYQKAQFYKLKWLEHKSDPDKARSAAKNLTHYISFLEILIPFKELIQIIGAEEDFFATGSIYGFREGDELGDKDYISHSMGVWGQENPDGSLASIMRAYNIIPNEFYGHWFMGRL